MTPGEAIAVSLGVVWAVLKLSLLLLGKSS